MHDSSISDYKVNLCYEATYSARQTKHSS